MKAFDHFNHCFVNVSVFGSVSRGNQDELSDFDVIAIVKDGEGKQSEAPIINWASRNNFSIPSISWYGEEKIKAFFSSGDLFAWHLFLESKPVPNFPSLRAQFGVPDQYTGAYSSIVELAKILFEIPKLIRNSPHTKKFEMGVAYVCLRNIAMAASWHLCDKPDFGRYSPFSIDAPAFPIARADYEILAQCRIAGQRGGPIPAKLPVNLEDIVIQATPWIAEIKKRVIQ